MGLSLEELKEREADIERQRKRLEERLKGRGKRIEDLHKEQERDRKQRKAKAERERELEKAIADAKKKRLWEERACLDGATTWFGLKLVIVTIAAKTPWEGLLVAADRTSHADDCGDKMSQAELYQLFLNGQGNPANPPGTSSHEGVNGGNGGSPVTTKVPTGAKLPPWMWGLDVGGVGSQFLAGAQQLGFEVRQMPGESWHFNFMSNPTDRLKKLGVV